jgi:hypothetical protein
MSSRAREIGIVKQNQQKMFSERINQKKGDSGRLLTALSNSIFLKAD